MFCAVASQKYPAGDQQIFERRLLRPFKRIGLPEAGKLHTFHHSLISKALAIGTPNATVRAWGGHVSNHVLALYTHVLDGESQSAIQRLSAATPSAGSITNAERPRIMTPQTKTGQCVTTTPCPENGEGGIRTPGAISDTQHFQCCTISRSATSPNLLRPCNHLVSCHHKGDHSTAIRSGQGETTAGFTLFPMETSRRTNGGATLDKVTQQPPRAYQPCALPPLRYWLRSRPLDSNVV